MTREVIKYGDIDENWKVGKTLLSIKYGTIAEVWKFKDDSGGTPTIFYAYRFYETQNTMYIPLVF